MKEGVEEEWRRATGGEKEWKNRDGIPASFGPPRWRTPPLAEVTLQGVSGAKRSRMEEADEQDE